MRKIKSCGNGIKKKNPPGWLLNQSFLQAGLCGGLGLGEVPITGKDPSVLLLHFKNKQTNCVLNLQYVLLVVY